MSLHTLCDETWACILAYLPPHYQAKFFITGDSMIQRRVVFARRDFEHFFMFANVQSDLVYNLLIPHAESVVTNAQFVERSFVFTDRAGATNFAIKRLTVSSVVKCGRGVHDMRRLRHLAYLKLQFQTYGNFILPKSLTSLTVHCTSSGRDFWFKRIVNRESLIHLTHLACPFTVEQLSSLGEKSWPPRLTSLSVGMCATSAKEVKLFQQNLRALPMTLIHLRLESSSMSSTNLFSIFPPLHCAQLESFEIWGGAGVFRGDAKRMFPASLKRLYAAHLFNRHPARPDPILEALTRSSITHFTFYKIELRRRADEADAIAGWQAILSNLVPRLELESVLGIIDNIVGTPFCNDQVSEACVRSLADSTFAHHFSSLSSASTTLQIIAAIILNDWWRSRGAAGISVKLGDTYAAEEQATFQIL